MASKLKSDKEFFEDTAQNLSIYKESMLGEKYSGQVEEARLEMIHFCREIVESEDWIVVDTGDADDTEPSCCDTCGDELTEAEAKSGQHRCTHCIENVVYCENCDQVIDYYEGSETGERICERCKD